MSISNLFTFNSHNLKAKTLYLYGDQETPTNPALTVNGPIHANGVISNVEATNGLYYKVCHAHLPVKLDGVPYNAFIGGVTVQGIETTLDLTDKDYGPYWGSNYTRFTGWIKAPHTGGLKSYTFYLLADDCAQVFINNTMVLVANYKQSEQSVTIDLDGDDYNPIIIEWAQTSGSNRLRLQWENVDIVKETIPSQYLINNQTGFAIGGTTCVDGTLSIMHTGQSTDATSGALTVAGGVGIAKDLVVGGKIYGSIYGTPRYLPFSFDVGGAFSGTGVLTGFFYILGNLIFMRIENYTQTATSSDSLRCSAGTLPVLVRPIASVEYCSTTVFDNALMTHGTMKIYSDGSLVWYVDNNTNFQNGTTIGFTNIVNTYSL